MLNFSLLDSFLEAIPSLGAHKNIHILRILILLTEIEIFPPPSVCLSSPVDLYPCCLAILSHMEKVICVSCFV